MTAVTFRSSGSDARPVRLCEATRQWAHESLQGKYGNEALQSFCMTVDDIEGFDALSGIEKYDVLIRRIAGKAPLRIVPGEPVSGSATLGMAVTHQIPAKFRDNAVFGSVSHLTIDFEDVVKNGIRRKEALTEEQLKRDDLTGRQRAFLLSCRHCFEAMHIYHERYLNALKGTENGELLKKVPFGPASTYREALQSIWFTFSFVRLCGNWPGIGRLDKMLKPFLEKELAEGSITLDAARELLAGFFIKGCEWVRSEHNPNSGDAQNYQNIVIGGVDEDGNDICGPATDLILDIVEELPIGDFPISFRISENTPRTTLEHAAKVVRHGGGVLAFYNEELILGALTDFGYSLKEARNFANDGCWEIQVPGKTYFRYVPFDGLKLLLSDTLHIDSEPAHFSDIEELKAAYKKVLTGAVEGIFRSITGYELVQTENGLLWKPMSPCTVVSMFEGGCIEHAASYFEGGAEYNVVAPHIGGAPDVGNSLCAIDRLCFKEKRIPFDEFMQVLKNDWKDNEPLRQYALHRLTYYGNDDNDADSYTASVLADFSSAVEALNGRCPIRFPAGVSTFGRQIEWAPHRTATPFGRHAGEILSGNTSPTPGTDIAGATAVIKSYCKADHRRLPNGAALDIRIMPSSLSGETGVRALCALLDGFRRLGGTFIQIDALDAETLKAAQADPENYRTLSVRVSGWNARFITLDRQWQQMVIERTELGL